MSEMQSNRRRQAQQELGLVDEKEQAQDARAMQAEQERIRRKEERRMDIELSTSYQMTQTIARWMDKYFLDPLIGLIPGLGDALSSLLVFPFIYVAAVKVRSLPLTLAVIFNVLRDMAIGLIPFWVGNILDFFNRAYLQNFRLIVGFVEDDREIIREVNRKAFWMGVGIVVCCILIYWLISIAIAATAWTFHFFSSLFS
ncbi:DUF4112 domain-containing protein [Bacteroides sp. Marseille-P3684]|uniref:DUF4112 domain-containing protein n=1 Tax=Bacteroides sp. Marseille-P3684 TaxID=2086579 RepID=UPI000D102933|nr:DUF4112 domain-containing protein [Bacteroides sp. Marseille-P3684]